MYGTLFHIRNKNPFNLEVLVDAWPEYQTVVIRPQKEVRPLAPEGQAAHPQDGDEGLQPGAGRGWGEDLDTPDSCRFGKGCLEERAGWRDEAREWTSEPIVRDLEVALEFHSASSLLSRLR